MKPVILLICFFLIPNAWAGIPVVDTINALKQYIVLMKQLEQLKKQVTQADNMIAESKQAIKDAEGHYGFGHLLDSDADYQQRQWGAAKWRDNLKNLSGGNSARYQELLREYQKKYSPLSKNQFSKGASQSLANNYQYMIDTNRVATASADYEYEKLRSQNNNIHQLANRIESAPNTKAAVDLNSRLIAELSYISIEQLRMQTLMNHQMAATIADETNAEKRESLFNRLPKEK